MRLIKNGQVLIDNRLEKKDILIDEGKIIQIGDPEQIYSFKTPLWQSIQSNARHYEYHQ